VKSYDLAITASSVNVLRDVKNYKFKKDKNGIFLDVPVHMFSHGCDAIRYPVQTHWGKEYLQMKYEDVKSVYTQQMESVGALSQW
jgi:phage terminase large subunit